MLVATAHELDALARRLGASRFPGVSSSVFDDAPASEHAPLADGLIANLVARQVVQVSDGRIEAIGPGGALLAPVVHGTVRIVVERTVGEDRTTTALGVDGDLVVWHRADGELHGFDLVADDGDPVPPVLELIDAPAAGPPVGEPSSFTTSRRRLARAVNGDVVRSLPTPFVEALDHWHATTTVTRLASADGTASAAWLTVVDGGLGRVWAIEADPADGADVFAGEEPGLLVRPVADVAHRMRSWWDAAAG